MNFEYMEVILHHAREHRVVMGTLCIRPESLVISFLHNSRRLSFRLREDGYVEYHIYFSSIREYTKNVMKKSDLVDAFDEFLSLI